MEVVAVGGERRAPGDQAMRDQAQGIDDRHQEPEDDNLGAKRVEADVVRIDRQKPDEDADRICPRIAEEQPPGEVESQRDAKAYREYQQQRAHMLGGVGEQKDRPQERKSDHQPILAVGHVHGVL